MSNTFILNPTPAKYTITEVFLDKDGCDIDCGVSLNDLASLVVALAAKYPGASIKFYEQGLAFRYKVYIQRQETEEEYALRVRAKMENADKRISNAKRMV